MRNDRMQGKNLMKGEMEDAENGHKKSGGEGEGGRELGKGKKGQGNV